MANPLQPKCIKILENEYNAHVINITAAGKAGEPDLVVCIAGEFWAFEIKWKNDQPSINQMVKLNRINGKGGRAHFIRSEDQLREIVNKRIPPPLYLHDYKVML